MSKIDLNFLKEIPNYVSINTCREISTFVKYYLEKNDIQCTIYEGAVAIPEKSILIKSHEWVEINELGIIDIGLLQVNNYLEEEQKIKLENILIRGVQEGENCEWVFYNKKYRLLETVFKERLKMKLDWERHQYIFNKLISKINKKIW